MTYRIFGDKGSGAFSAEAVLAEAGAPYEFHFVSLEKNEQKKPEFLTINPSGKIPALRLPEGEIVTESAGILLTVADHFPNARLLPPQAGPLRAQAYRWLAFMASEVYPMIEVVDYPERFVPEGEVAAALKAKARGRVRERMLIVERMVRGPWFLGESFSVLDIYAVMFNRWIGKDWRDVNLPRLNTLARALSERPAMTPVWERHFIDRP